MNFIENKSESNSANEDTQTYIIKPIYKNTCYEEEIWSNMLSNKKCVSIGVITNFRWGKCQVELTENEKQNISEMDTINLTEIGLSCPELFSGYPYDIEIKNKETYSKEEIQEIKRLIYVSDNEERDYDTDNDNCIIDDLNDNGWDLDDTIYEIVNGCNIRHIDEEGEGEDESEDESEDEEYESSDD